MMDSSEQRRKRKRSLLPYSHPFSSSKHLLSVRSFLLCFILLTCLYLFSFTIHFHIKFSSSYKPVILSSTLSFLSSYATSSDDFRNSYYFLEIDDRVLLPNHVLLLVSSVNIHLLVKKSEDFKCVYRNERLNGVLRKDVLSIDEYDEFRFIVRCPLPPVNYSSVVNIGTSGKDMEFIGNESVNSWENLAYAATLDGDTVVVFVKGLNLRQGRESNPSQFTCHFGSNGELTKAVSAAQEVVRCLLPPSIRENPAKAHGIQVSVGATTHYHDRVVLPSVAKILNPTIHEKEKYELCGCTMVWNQASSLREWVTYHSWLGVEKWFIYDNNSDDGIKQVINDLNLEGYNVTRHVWPWVKTQEAGFSHCALRAKDECNWVSFMDVDEFFYFPYSTPGHQNLKTLVQNFTSSSTKIAEIRTSCHSFGPSGLSSAPPQGVTVGYTCRLQSPERHKSIIRPDAIDTTLLNVVHHFRLREGFRYVNLPMSVAVINHYKYQVWDVFKAKFYRRVATYVADWQENQNEGSRDRAPGLGTEAIEPPNWRLQFCEVWDTGLRDLVLGNLADKFTGLLPWERSSM